jgi:hypothetical protein
MVRRRSLLCIGCSDPSDARNFRRGFDSLFQQLLQQNPAALPVLLPLSYTVAALLSQGNPLLISVFLSLFVPPFFLHSISGRTPRGCDPGSSIIPPVRPRHCTAATGRNLFGCLFSVSSANRPAGLLPVFGSAAPPAALDHSTARCAHPSPSVD